MSSVGKVAGSKQGAPNEASREAASGAPGERVGAPPGPGTPSLARLMHIHASSVGVAAGGRAQGAGTRFGQRRALVLTPPLDWWHLYQARPCACIGVGGVTSGALGGRSPPRPAGPAQLLIAGRIQRQPGAAAGEAWPPRPAAAVTGKAASPPPWPASGPLAAAAAAASLLSGAIAFLKESRVKSAARRNS